MRMLNVPNIISLARIAAVPALVYMLVLVQRFEGAAGGDARLSFYAALIFGVAAMSDVVDGFLARRSGSVTVFGQLVDPLADKLLTFAGLIMLIPLDRMAAWVVVLLLAREIGVTTLRSIASSHGVVIPAGRWGKLKSGFSNFGIPFIMMYYPHYGVQWYELGWLLLLISLVLAMVSGVQYAVRFFRSAKL